MDIYKCGKCGTMVDEIKHVGCHPSCCGQPMTLLVPGTSDGAVEKHLPVASVEGNKVSVVVGSVELSAVLLEVVFVVLTVVCSVLLSVENSVGLDVTSVIGSSGVLLSAVETIEFLFSVVSIAK